MAGPERADHRDQVLVPLEEAMDAIKKMQKIYKQNPSISQGALETSKQLYNKMESEFKQVDEDNDVIRQSSRAIMEWMRESTDKPKDQKFGPGLHFDGRDYFRAMISEDGAKTNTGWEMYRNGLGKWLQDNWLKGKFEDKSAWDQPMSDEYEKKTLRCVHRKVCVEYKVKTLLADTFDRVLNHGLQASGSDATIQWMIKEYAEEDIDWSKPGQWRFDPKSPGSKTGQDKAKMLLKGGGGDKGFGFNEVLKKCLRMR